jgi:hypothetical protein
MSRSGAGLDVDEKAGDTIAREVPFPQVELIMGRLIRTPAAEAAHGGEVKRSLLALTM